MKNDSHIPKFDPAVYEHVPIDSLKPNPRNARTHPKKQIRELANCVQFVGFINPLIIDENGMVLAGHGRWEAAKTLKMKTVPVLRFENLNEAQKRAYALADNKLSEKAGWDYEILSIELGDAAVFLSDHNFDVTITGFEIGEIDAIINDRAKEPSPKGDEIDDGGIPALSKHPVTRRGDMFVLGPHRLLCGDARSLADIDLLMQGDKARMAFLDPPYNVRIRGHVGGRGAIKHDEFAFASGEMSPSEFIAFLGESLGQAARVSVDGALHYVAMDWRHLHELRAASKDCYSAQLNLCVWAKTSPGQGSLYRSQHELISVFKVGEAPHRNGVELGRHGRSRSNLWSYSGANSFKAGGLEELAWHPTVKPVAMVADAMRDCTMKGEIVLDTFLGSGTTLIAAERIGRVCRGVEYEPKYVDVAIQRWQAWTKLEAICAATGKTFDELAAERSASTGSDGAEQTQVIQ
jgi:DNA modification methylase